MDKLASTLKRIMVVAFACVLAFCVTACGPKPEEEVKSVIDATFETLKDPVKNNVASLIDPSSTELLKSYGVDANEFLAHAFENLEYTIDEVIVSEEGDKATAKLTISNVSLDDALAAAIDEFNAWSATDDALTTYQEGGEEALFTYLIDLVYAQFDKLSESKVSNPATLALTKGEEGWDLDEGAETNEEFFAALLGGGSLQSL